jgi:predicted  nucleic acid-binding Zn-ribbon protein
LTATTGASSLRLQVSVLNKQMQRLKRERDDALQELQQILEGLEGTEATLSNLREQIQRCGACQERRRARAESRDW